MRKPATASLSRARSARVAIALAAFALVAAFALTGHAQQARTVSDGVYSAEQAQRGAALYKAQCAACHGEKLEGVIGPMLAGEGFVAAWGGRSLAELADKIQNTMPLQAPGSLMRPQTIDLAAYMLQVGNFKAGSTALADAGLKTTTFPASRPAATDCRCRRSDAHFNGESRAVHAGCDLSEREHHLQHASQGPGCDKTGEPCAVRLRPVGSHHVHGWQAVDQAALALIETTPMFMVPGRRCENGRPVPIQNADFQKFTQELVALSRELYKASQSRNPDAVSGMSEKLNDACANCHKVYRDVGTAEGGGLGTDRCKP